MKKTIVVNGREYSSVEEMPPEVRRQYEEAMSVLADRDGNGIPDIMETNLSGRHESGDGLHRVSVETRSEFVVNGQEYSSLDEMPPDVRETVGGMMRKLPQDGEGESIHTLETEIILEDTPGFPEPDRRRIGPRHGTAPDSQLIGGGKSSRGGLGWLVAMILGLALVWVLISG